MKRRALASASPETEWTAVGPPLAPVDVAQPRPGALRDETVAARGGERDALLEAPPRGGDFVAFELDETESVVAFGVLR